jgi:hypothetical protein
MPPNPASSLIVDFPACRQKKTVQFTLKSQGRLINYSTPEELRKKWYSIEDEHKFRQRLHRDVFKWSIKLAAYAQDRRGLTTDDHIRCVGIDNLLSRNPNGRNEAIKAVRKAHAKIVLDAQFMGVSLLDLARVSEKSSYKARKRSFKVAAFLSMLE